MPRPQDVASDEYETLVALGREGRYTEVYERMRIKLFDHRAEIPRELPFTPPFNKWSANLPVDLLRPRDRSDGALPDDPVRGPWRPVRVLLPRRDWLTRAAGVGRFARSKGGHLFDDVKDGRVGTIDEIETYLLELCGFEQGLMLQNVALATEALGLGGFPHYGAHRFAWTNALGFEMRGRTFAQVLTRGSSARS